MSEHTLCYDCIYARWPNTRRRPGYCEFLRYVPMPSAVAPTHLLSVPLIAPTTAYTGPRRVTSCRCHAIPREQIPDAIRERCENQEGLL